MVTRTAHPGRRSGLGLALAAALATTVAVSGTSTAADRPTCTRGDAKSVLQAGMVGYSKLLAGHPERGIAYSTSHCQVQLSADGAHYTFAADDVFALQQTWFHPWRCFFDTPGASRADFALLEDRAWIAPVDNGVVGAETEIDLAVTPIKTVAFTADLNAPGWEGCFDGPVTQVHYRMAGFVADLAPGEYQTRWQGSYDGDLIGTATVRLTVTGD